MSRQGITDDLDLACKHVEDKWAEAFLVFEQAVEGYQSLPNVRAIKFGFIEVDELLTNLSAKRSYMSAMMHTIKNQL
ncbi:hypothetical protein DMH03_05735 [Amycolatopsis sp. WAC 01376]|nr:hypothetical protein DMH03_05735 [Amycolatopsis sp. WAC 01376]